MFVIAAINFALAAVNFSLSFINLWTGNRRTSALCAMVGLCAIGLGIFSLWRAAAGAI